MIEYCITDAWLFFEISILDKENQHIMNTYDKIALRQEVVETYDQLIANTEDLALKQFFIEEKLKVEQRINEFWMRKVFLIL